MAKKSSYMNRALRSNDRRFATVLGKMGYARSDIRADATSTKAAAPKKKKAAPEPVIDATEDADKIALDGAREEYQLKMGKRPFMGWDIDTLNEKMKEGIANKTADEKKAGKESD